MFSYSRYFIKQVAFCTRQYFLRSTHIYTHNSNASIFTPLNCTPLCMNKCASMDRVTSPVIDAQAIFNFSLLQHEWNDHSCSFLLRSWEPSSRPLFHTLVFHLVTCQVHCWDLDRAGLYSSAGEVPPLGKVRACTELMNSPKNHWTRSVSHSVLL